MPTDTEESSIHFAWGDYLIFSLTLIASLLIGIYHAYKGAGSSTTNYLLGGKMMAIFPIAMSLSSSTVSTNTMLGMPTDVYLTGSMMFWMPIAIAIETPLSAYVLFPLLQDLEILSVTKYLEMRFHRIIRRIYSVLSIFDYLFFLSMLTYSPSLALSQVTGLHVYICCTITFVVVTFYTTIGGMKAVVWSDTLQIFLMLGSVSALVIKGMMDIGVNNVWERNVKSGRIEFFNVSLDPTVHKTIWSMLLGSCVGWVVPRQGIYQRFLSVSTRRSAQKALFISIIVVDVFMSLCCFTGLLAFAKYFDCDPLKAKIISKADQILPYFLMDTLGNIPGMSGLFVAGLFSASLSTLSTVLNGLALNILEDFVRPFYPNLTDLTSTKISKLISFSMGVIAFAMVFLVSNAETILETGWSIGGAFSGMSIGLFLLGLLVPWANTIGAIVGTLVSYGLMITLGICTQTARARGNFPNKQLKPRSIENCVKLNTTDYLQDLYGRGNYTHQQQTGNDEGFNILSVSFMWYSLIGALISVLVGTVTSFLTGPQDIDQLDPKLVFRFMRRWIGKKRTNSIIMEEDKKEIKKNGETNKGFESESKD